MKKRLISLLAVISMTAGLLTGCGGKATDAEQNVPSTAGTEETAQNGEDGMWDGETDHIIMTYLTLGNTPADLQMVQDAINERTIPEIGVEVEMKAVSAFDAFSQFPTWLVSGETIDLMMPLLQDLNPYINQGLIMPLNDLIKENAPYIQELTDQGYSFASNNTVNGNIYSILQIPNVTGAGGGFLIQTEYLNEIGYEIEEGKVYTEDDLTDIFAKIKELHPDMYPCGEVTTGRSDSQFNYAGGIYDALGAKSYTGVLFGTEGEEVIDLYETDEYMSHLKHLREWYQAGYIYPDATTTDATNVSLLASKVSAGYFMVSAPVQVKDDQTMIRLSELFQSSQGMGGWVVPATSKEPEAAMRFLNLMYKDVDLMNLLQWGIEGTHYVMLDETSGLIGFPEGIDANSSGYYNTLGLYGDSRKIYTWTEGNDQAANDNYSAEAMKNPTKGVGMIYNPSDEMNAKIAALGAVAAEYIPALESGSVDPEVYCPQFVQALKDAGLEDVMKEKQEQFDAWLSEK